MTDKTEVLGTFRVSKSNWETLKKARKASGMSWSNFALYMAKLVDLDNAGKLIKKGSNING